VKRTAELYRAESRRAETAWQRSAGHLDTDVTMRRKAPAPSPRESFDPHRKGGSAPTTIAKALYPHPDSALRQSEIVRRDAPQGSIASRIFPNLPREGGK